MPNLCWNFYVFSSIFMIDLRNWHGPLLLKVEIELGHFVLIKLFRYPNFWNFCRFWNFQNFGDFSWQFTTWNTNFRGKQSDVYSVECEWPELKDEGKRGCEGGRAWKRLNEREEVNKQTNNNKEEEKNEVIEESEVNESTSE